MKTKAQAWYGTGIGDYAREKLLARWPDEAVVRAVKAKFPNAGTKIRSIKWYRSTARQEGLPVPTNSEARAEWPKRRAEALGEIGGDPFDDVPAEDDADRKEL